MKREDSKFSAPDMGEGRQHPLAVPDAAVFVGTSLLCNRRGVAEP